MEEQSYAKHAKLVPLFHQVLLPLILLAIIGSGFSLYKSISSHLWRWSALTVGALAIAMMLTAFFARVFALKAQDRAIRAEENLRHFAMTGKLLDKRLSVKQIIGLRFASDGEFVALAQKAADEGLSLDAIKKSVKNWRVDNDRL